MNVSVVIPAANEESCIEHTIREYIRFLKKKKVAFEIVVVTNNCRDRTPQIVASLKKEFPRVIVHKDIPYYVGKGGALVEGFQLASGKAVAYVDADNATKAEQLWGLYEMFRRSPEYSCVMGSRWMRGARFVKKQSLLRRFLSRGFNLYVRLVLGLQYSDTQCGGKVFNAQHVYNILDDITITGWAFDVNVLYLMRKRGYKIKEVPIAWEDANTSGLKIIPAMKGMFSAVLKIRFGKK